MVLVAAIALGSSTYAWFVQNARVTATGPSVTSNTAYSLLISNGASYQNNWRTAVDMATTSGLTPVSTKGEQVTAEQVAVDGILYDTGAAEGDIRFVTSKDWANNVVTTYDEVNKTSIASGSNKYYYTDTIYLKAGQASKIYLDGSAASDTDSSVATGIKWPDGTGAVKTWSFSAFATTASGTTATTLAATYDHDSDAGTDALNLADAQALLKTLRVGLMVTDTNDEFGKTTNADDKGFYVYTLGDDTALGSNTESINTTTGDANGITAVIGPVTDSKAVGASLTKTEIKDTSVFKNGTSTGVPNITTAIATGSSNAFATDTTDKVAIAEVKANDVVQVDVYVWMEGCDYDVTSGNLEKFAESTIPGMSFGFCVGAA